MGMGRADPSACSIRPIELADLLRKHAPKLEELYFQDDDDFSADVLDYFEGKEGFVPRFNTEISV